MQDAMRSPSMIACLQRICQCDVSDIDITSR